MGHLPKINFGGIRRPAFGQGARPAEPPMPQHKGKALSRRMMMFKEAASLLSALPAPGEAVHCVTSGRYDLAVLVAALIDQHPTPCRRLTISTLAYAQRNAVELLTMLQDGKVGGLTLLASKFFQRHYKELDSWLREELRAFPGSRYGTARTHCKIVCLDWPDAALVLEGSANLRANSNWENLLVCHDRDLLDFHTRWIEEQVSHDHPDDDHTRDTARPKGQAGEDHQDGP